MAGLRFLEKLRRMRYETESRDSVGAEEVLSSVTDYVSKILNTRQGSTLLDEEFGIPDFTSAGLSFTNEDIPRLEQEIGNFVARCEPRLRDVKVRFSPDPESPLQLIFSLNAELRLPDDEHMPVHLTTCVNPSGRVTVSR